jgi:YVTN family beta-propeller protein
MRKKKTVRRFALAALLWAGLGPAHAASLAPDGTIALPDVSGRIDHMAIDLPRQRLFVAELGNGTVDVVDLATRKVIHRVGGLQEPQGIAYSEKSDFVAVACGGDGTVRLYDGKDFKLRSTISLGSDADNVRLDPRTGNLVVGYGDGALAVINPGKGRKVRDIPLPGHPESFRLDGATAYVNVPDAGQIVVADLDNGKVVARWKPDHLAANFPMILDEQGHAAVVFRSPARLVLFETGTGTPAAAIDTCGDADDIFHNGNAFYVSCGAGKLDVIGSGDGKLMRIARLETSWGARTSLFVPQLHRLFVAKRAGLMGSNAAIAVFRSE